MYTVGITGGVGSGKSAVLKEIAAYCQEKELGGKPIRAVIIEMDKLAKEMQAKGEALFLDIVEAFGQGIVAEDGELNRGALAEIVFHDDAKLKLLNQLVHPAVKRAVHRKYEEAKQQGYHVFIMESALLFEEGYQALCDSVWMIHTYDPVRIVRLRMNRGYTEEKAKAIIEAQKSPEEYMEKCNIVIHNNEKFEETALFVRQLMDTICMLEEGNSEHEVI